MRRLHERTLRAIGLVAILGLAAFVRLWDLGATEFKYDEATVCNLAAHWVDTGILPVRGMGSSVGIDNPPLAVYLMSLPVLFSRDPLVSSGFVALLNVAAVWACYQLGRRFWSAPVGMLAALLLAVSPWAVFYSRKVWAQNLLPPFVILFFFLLLAWAVERRAWALSGAVVALAALTQIHFATLALLPVLALPVLIAMLAAAMQRLRHRADARIRWPAPLWGPLGVGVGASLLSYAPYLVADAQAGWRNVRALLEVMRTQAQMRWEVGRFALLNVGGREIHALAGPEQFRHFLDGILDLGYWPDRAEEAFVVLGFLYLVVCWWRGLNAEAQRRGGTQGGKGQIASETLAVQDGRRDGRRDGLLILWLISPLLFYLRSSVEVFPHYLIPLYPAPYLALAIAAVDLGRWASRWVALKLRTDICPPGRQDDGVPPGACPPGVCPRAPVVLWALRAAGGLALGGLVAWQSYLSLSIYAFVGAHDTPGGMGTPVRVYRDVVRTMERYAHAWDNRQVIVLCPGDNPRWDECPAVFRFLASRSFEARFADYDQALLFPRTRSDTLIVLAPGESVAAGELPQHAQELAGEAIPLRELDVVGVRTNVRRTNVRGAYRFYRLAAGYAPEPPPQRIEQRIQAQPAGMPAHLANGVTLLGYGLSNLPAPGRTARLALYWRVDALPADPPAQGYSFANHLLAADGQRYGQKDGPGYPVEQWREGDTVVSWFDLALDAGAPPWPYQLRVGMYVYTPPDQFAAVPFVDVAGQPVADAVTWPLEQ